MSSCLGPPCRKIKGSAVSLSLILRLSFMNFTVLSPFHIGNLKRSSLKCELDCVLFLPETGKKLVIYLHICIVKIFRVSSGIFRITHILAPTLYFQNAFIWHSLCLTLKCLTACYCCFLSLYLQGHA